MLNPLRYHITALSMGDGFPWATAFHIDWFSIDLG